jgi:Insulin-induced protein (INSIG)
MESQDPPIIRPIPRRTFEVTPASTESSSSSTPDVNPHFLDAKYNSDVPPATPSRSRSLLNLTSSTLFGIYSSPSGSFGDREEPLTPWGTGADVGSRWQSMEDVRPISKDRILRRVTPYHGNHVGFKNFILPLALRVVLLFVFGIAYGTMVTHLHDNRHVAPVRIEGFDRSGWRYLTFWGIAGVGLGSLLPWVDFLWEDKLEPEEAIDTKEKKNGMGATGGAGETPDETGNGLAADWNPVVRSVGAFVGIAFAIVRVAYPDCPSMCV